MGKRYSDKELTEVGNLIKKYGHLFYHMGAAIEEEYLRRTGIHRASGAIYMVAWRVEKGMYAHRGIAV